MEDSDRKPKESLSVYEARKLAEYASLAGVKQCVMMRRYRLAYEKDGAAEVAKRRQSLLEELAKCEDALGKIGLAPCPEKDPAPKKQAPAKAAPTARAKKSDRGKADGGQELLVFECDWPGCDKIFRSETKRNIHRGGHSSYANGSKTRCKYCGGLFPAGMALVHHERACFRELDEKTRPGYGGDAGDGPQVNA